MPREPREGEARLIRRLVAAQRIAVVGAHHQEDRAAHYVPAYLLGAGKTILPVNPRYEQLFGVPCYASLAAVPGKIDLVNVFRRAEACPEVVRQAIAVGAKAIWLQSGIISNEAAELARAAGLDFVQDRCLMVEHRRHVQR